MIIGVLVEITNKSVDKVFDYKVKDEYAPLIKVGMRVTVPFAHIVLEGFIVEVKNVSDSNRQLKEVLSLVDDEVVLTEELLALGKTLQKETLASLVSCYQVMLPKALKAKQGTMIKKKMMKVYYFHSERSIPLTTSQQEIIAAFQEKKCLPRSALKSFSSARLATLVKKGVLEEREEEVYRLTYEEQSLKTFTLTSDQQKAVDEISESSDFIFLLHGVTGSGKTEVYMELIANTLKLGKQSIVLVPEISLTPQIIKRFQRRFGNQIALLHSALSEGEKYDEYRKIRKGGVSIVIGARSAVFAPLKNIGIIIVDEEHSDSYKQDNNPRYDARNVAIERAKYHGSKVVLGSATPTLESYARALKGRYHLITLSHRVNGKPLPPVELVDMNEAIKTAKGHFSLRLIEEIEKRLQKKEQVILLLNRRGYASFLSCKQCGYVKKCPHCDITLTYHKSSHTLRCHYCGYGTGVDLTCPECHEKSLQDLGVGTEKIEEEISELFPQSKVIRMDVDTTSRKGSHEKMITSFTNHEADILLGTQIVAKGLDFADVTLVGVINADTSLMIPDFRSSEVTYSLLSQVSGRSGRSDKEGRVIFQTFNPTHYALVCAKENNYQKFYQEEMKIRRMMKYPPFYYLVLIHLASKDNQTALLEASRCEKVLTKYLDKTIILGPSPASVFKKMNIYRYQLILKYQYQDNLETILNKLVTYYATQQKVTLEIDFSPRHL